MLRRRTTGTLRQARTNLVIDRPNVGHSTVVRLIPVLLPPAMLMGVDPIHMLVVVVITLTLGLVTPPVGVCLFAVSKVSGLSIEQVVRGSRGPVSILMLAILALVLFPVLVIGPLKLLGLY